MLAVDAMHDGSVFYDEVMQVVQAAIEYGFVPEIGTNLIRLAMK